MTPHTRFPTPTPVDSDAGAHLARLLDAEIAFDPVARGGFINHTAMALVAMWRMGAGVGDLEALYEKDVSSGFILPRDQPEELSTTQGEVTRSGIGPAVRRAAPRFVHAPASQFFHAAIRLEYALDVGHGPQAANALHNWERYDTGLGDLPPRTGNRPFADVAYDLARSPEMRAAHSFDLREVADATWFRESLAQADLGDPRLLDAVAEVALAAHIHGDNFGSLHLVTGTRAARAVAAALDPSDAWTLAAHTAQAVAAGLGQARGSLADTAEMAEMRTRPAVPWSDIAQAAIASGDHHVIKLVYTCRCEQVATGDALYQRVAARQAGLG